MNVTERFDRAQQGADRYPCDECGLTYPSQRDADECARLDLDPRKEDHRKARS